MSTYRADAVTRKWRHWGRPVAASRANALASVAPYTRFPPTASPFGPGFRAPKSRRHSSRPDFRSSAKTLLRMSCTYTTPPCTTGVAVNAPDSPGGTRKAKRHATWRVPTLVRSMPLSVSVRVDVRSWFGSGQSARPRDPPQPASASKSDTAAIVRNRLSRSEAGMQLGARLPLLAERQVGEVPRQRRGDVVRDGGHLCDLEVRADESVPGHHAVDHLRLET